MEHEEYMKIALDLAAKGEGAVAPNPMVGCVVVKDGVIVATGYHKRFGENHAERDALTSYDGDLLGADLYVTLEPCCHYGKTPPCTDIIIERGIGRVFVGCKDPNPSVSGKGIEILRRHGVMVETGILESECRRLNEVFLFGMEYHRPFVAMKYAMTIDGKSACVGGDSKWVTSEETRARVQTLRNRYKGIMAGIGTVLADDPMLNLRLEGARGEHVRVITDTFLRVPLSSKVVRTADSIQTLIACSDRIKDDEKYNGKIRSLRDAGVRILFVPEEDGMIDLSVLMSRLYDDGIDGILLEGGGTLNASMLSKNLVNKAYIYIAPKIIGGRDALSPVEGNGVRQMSDALILKSVRTENTGEDLLVTGYF